MGMDGKASKEISQMKGGPSPLADFQLELLRFHQPVLVKLAFKAI